jgi:hypothetical protein
MDTIARFSAALSRVAILLMLPFVATAGPIADSIQVGDEVMGAFRYSLSQAPADASPLPFRGEYRFTDPNSFIRLSIGEHTFSSAVGATFIPSRPGHLSVIVTDFVAPFDQIQISGIGDEASFAPFVSFFSRQDPTLRPLGTMLVNFTLDPNALTSDALPAVIDPSAMMPVDSFPAVFGQIEGVSTQPPDEAEAAATREWVIFYEVEPRDVTIENNIVSGQFVGRVTGVEDFSELLPPNEMLDVLRQQVTGVGPGRSLQRKIENAQAYYLASDLAAACATLSAFSAQVRAQSGKSIPVATANQLLAETAALRIAIDCD